MQKLKVAASALLKDKLQVEREVVCLSNADFTEVSAVVIDIEDYRKGGLNKVNATALEIPFFFISAMKTPLRKNSSVTWSV